MNPRLLHSLPLLFAAFSARESVGKEWDNARESGERELGNAGKTIGGVFGF